MVNRENVQSIMKKLNKLEDNVTEDPKKAFVQKKSDIPVWRSTELWAGFDRLNHELGNLVELPVEHVNDIIQVKTYEELLKRLVMFAKFYIE